MQAPQTAKPGGDANQMATHATSAAYTGDIAGKRTLMKSSASMQPRTSPQKCGNNFQNARSRTSPFLPGCPRRLRCAEGGTGSGATRTPSAARAGRRCSRADAPAGLLVLPLAKKVPVLGRSSFLLLATIRIKCLGSKEKNQPMQMYNVQTMYRVFLCNYCIECNDQF